MSTARAIHHVFPYDPRHLGLSSAAWIAAQVVRWPLASVAHATTAPQTLVHFISPVPVRATAGGLAFIGHPAGYPLGPAGPRWWDWGDDWSPSLGRTLAGLGAADLCVLHLDSYLAAARAHYAARHSRVAVVLHGRGFPGAHIRAADAVIALRQDVRAAFLAEGYPPARLHVAIPSLDRALFHAEVGSRQQAAGSRQYTIGRDDAAGRAQWVADSSMNSTLPTPHPSRPPASGLRPTPLRLGFVGNLVAAKGLAQLGETVDALAAAGVAFRLEIVGTGPGADAQALRARLEPAGMGGPVQFLGQLAAADVAARMRNWHLLLQPSWTEGFSLVVLEALAVGLPVVVVAGVLPPELEGQAGVHPVARADYAAFVAAHHARLAATACARDLVHDHCEAAALWNALATIPRRGAPVPAPPGGRYWRLRPLRALVQDRPGLRRLVRRLRRRLGPLGGLNIAHVEF